jgi:hypothetical protein
VVLRLVLFQTDVPSENWMVEILLDLPYYSYSIGLRRDFREDVTATVVVIYFFQANLVHRELSQHYAHLHSPNPRYD